MLATNRTLYWACLIAVGALNAFIKPIIQSIEHSGFWPASLNLFDIHPVMVGVIVLVIALIYDPHSKQSLTQRDLVVGLFLLAGLLIPSATMSWLFLGLFAAVLSTDKTITPTQRNAAIILMVAGFREPIMTFLLQVFNAQILTLDARLTAQLLSVFHENVTAQGNMILAIDEVRLVVLTSCSSLANLSFALLFWFAINRTFSSKLTKDMLLSGVGILMSMVILNVIRLTMMASSSEQYAIIHETVGKTVFAVIMVAMVFMITAWGIRNVTPSTHRNSAHSHPGNP